MRYLIIVYIMMALSITDNYYGKELRNDRNENPYSRYGNKFRTEGLENPYGKYGNKYSPESQKNPYSRYGNKFSLDYGAFQPEQRQEKRYKFKIRDY